MRRTSPFSTQYGWDRGRPVDRFYIEQFLGAHSAAIAGDVLEVRDDGYIRAFGGSRVRTSHIVDIDPANRRATIVADLCEVGSLGSDRFDAIVLTQVLFLVDDPDAALRNAWQALRPGGCLLLTEPCIQRIDPHDPQLDRRRWTPLGFETWLRTTLPGARIGSQGLGNVLAAAASLMGLAVEELPVRDLAVQDPAFPLVVCARVDRPS